MEATLWILGITTFLLFLFWLWASFAPVKPLDTADWQKPIMAENNIRRVLGFIPALLLFIFFNQPPWSEINTFGLILGMLFAVLGYIFLNPGNIFFVPFRKYIKWYRIWSPYEGAIQVMAFEGEAGWQPGKKLQGTRYIIVAWNQIGIFRYTHVAANAVWYLRSRVGDVLPAGRKTANCMPLEYPPTTYKEEYGKDKKQVADKKGVERQPAFFYENPAIFKEVGGQLNIQRNILTPGYFGPIDLVAFEVDDGSLADSQPKGNKPEDDFYKPYRIPDGEFAMVTCLDSGYPMPQGAIFARLGGFKDIEEVIADYCGDDEAEISRSEDEKKAHKLVATLNNNEDKEKIIFSQKMAENLEKETGEKPEGIIDNKLYKGGYGKYAKIKKNEDIIEHDKVKAYPDIFKYPLKEERELAGKCLKLLLEGPQLRVEDYQNVRIFDDFEGTLGPHWRLIRPGRLLNLNRFVFSVTLINPLIVEPGTVVVLILATGVLSRDITQRGFIGGKIVRMGGHGINNKALEPAQYPIPGFKRPTEKKELIDVKVRRRGKDSEKNKEEIKQISKIEHVQVGQLATFVTVPTRQLSLFFRSDYPTSVYDADLNTIRERSKDGIWVEFDFNVLVTIPAEAAAVIVAAYGDPLEFITRVIATIVYGETVQYIRTNNVVDIVASTITEILVVSEQTDITEEKKETTKGEPAVITRLESALREAVQFKYGVYIEKVKMEHFEAEDYLTALEKQAIAQAEKKAVVAQTEVAEEKKKLQLAEGQALANFTAAKAKGEAEAITVTYEAMVKQFGKEGATAIQAIKDMTSGKHPFIPAVLGVAGDGSPTSGLIPAAALLGGLMDRVKEAAEKALVVKTETKNDSSKTKESKD